MALQRHVPLLVLLLIFWSSSSNAYQIDVGGIDDLIANPFESYNQWAKQMRFQVNDTLCKYHHMLSRLIC